MKGEIVYIPNSLNNQVLISSQTICGWEITEYFTGKTYVKKKNPSIKKIRSD
jgi:hypothetical protein